MIHWFTAIRLVACLSFTALATAGFPTVPAHADEHGHDRGDFHDLGDDHGHHHEHDNHRHDDHHHGYDEGTDRWWEHRHDEYRRPDVYYGAPPIVVAPPGYYVQPGVNLNLVIPLFR